ncbi:MAG: FecR domain-containing protein [Bacteroides sp.]|nr:FecR domain-containing protein [Bacteroides sp.]
MKEQSEVNMLFQRYVDNLYTKEDVCNMFEIIRQPDNEQTLDKLANHVWEESEVQSMSTGVECERYKKEAKQILKRIGTRKRNWMHRVAIYIAGISAMLCLIWGAVKYADYLTESQLIEMEVSTTYGEHKQITLPDGTVLVLNSCSKVRYPNRFISNERKIELEGEGYFNVKRKEDQPFVIITPCLDVRVLGTAFNVKTYAADELVSVSVESGKVQIDLPDAMLRLQAQEQMQLNTRTGNYNKSSVEQKVALWRKGTLCFDRTPIRDVAKELERIYHCRITFAEGENFDNLISGEHENPNLEAVLRSIEYTSGIRYKKNGNNIFLYR